MSPPKADYLRPFRYKLISPSNLEKSARRLDTVCKSVPEQRYDIGRFGWQNLKSGRGIMHVPNHELTAVTCQVYPRGLQGNMSYDQLSDITSTAKYSGNIMLQ